MEGVSGYFHVGNTSGFVSVFYFILGFDNFFFSFLQPHPQHMEVPRLGLKSELQLPTYTTATTSPDP